MTTYPTGVKKIIYNGPLETEIRVPARNWPDFCTLAVAEQVVGMINALPAIIALGLVFPPPTADPEVVEDYVLDDPNQPINIWDTTATDKNGRVVEFGPLGSILDREKYPVPFLDIENPDTTLGGPVLHVVDLGYTLELAWGK